MKQRRKAILALLLSASVAASPIVSATSVFAEDLDFATVEETEVTSEDAGSDFSDDSISIEDSDDVTEADTADDSILIDNSDSAEYSESDTDVFSAGDEVDAFTAADEVSVQADEEAKTHSIKVTVVNSKGVVSGMYAMDNAIITKQDDGTYLVKMHQASENREYMALTNDIPAATQHRVDWYVADSNWYYTIPVANLTDPVYASFSYAKNVNKGSKWGNVQTITFDTSSMADTTEPDVDASGMNKQVALDYTAADAALASVPEDLSIYTDETAKAVTDAVNKLKGNYKATQQSDVDTLVTALTDAVKALRKKAVSLTVTNKTGMFNVTDAVLDNDKLIVTLHGTGYHYLYKGTYEEAVETVKEAVKPLGEDYCKVFNKALDTDRWVDKYENKGKRSGAYSWGAYGCHPFVSMNYNGTVDSMFTLIHEMGHSMHSHYTWSTQPVVYGDYTIFVAEVASTVNEALLMEHLLKTTEDKNQRKYLINYYLEQFRGTLFRQTMFAEFELEVHRRDEAGEALTKEELNEIYYNLNKKYYGDEINIDEKISWEWARIPHFYTAFYVYQYATGYSAAIALAQRILKENGKDDYINFLKGGSSKYSIDLLKGAGVDMTTAEPVEKAMEVFANLLDEMENLLTEE